MENVYEELDEAKAEIEKLKSENRRKEELSASLKKSNNDQLIKIQEASSKIEKQAQELIEKGGEISVTKQLCEDLKCSLNEKESTIKHLRTANDKLRVDCDEKSQKWEEENRVLVLALDEANEKNMDQEQKIYAFKEEIEGLKSLLAIAQKKCLEAEERTKAARELREGDHTLLDLEEENKRLADQLKWKKEQFTHLEEAHEKLQEQFKTSKKEWEMEKSTLFDEISSLQTRLDSQTRISEDLQNRLQMCHQALAHEESRRKHLEVQVSEFQTRFENAFAESQDAKDDRLTAQRDEEIGALRNSLGEKETLYKETEYRAQKLEQENQELLISLKDLREAQIHESGTKSSLAKLRIKLKAMEQKHRNCSTNLKVKEAEWSSQLEKLTKDFNDCRSELESKDKAIEELLTELEDCHSLMTQLKLQNEEAEWNSQLAKMTKDFNDCKSELESKDKAIEELLMELEGCHSLMTQLKLQNGDWSSQLAKKTKEFNDCRSELDSKDRAIEELMVELESCHSIMTQLKSQIEEAEWSSQLEKMRRDFNDCRSELEMKDKAIEELLTELEDCHSLMTQLKLQNEEAERSSQLSKMTRDYNDRGSQLESKDRAIEELMMEVEGCHSLITQLMLQNEETSMMLMVLKSGISEAQMKVISKEDETDLRNKEREEKVETLFRRTETSVDIQEQQIVMQKELERYKEMLDEVSRCKLHLKEQALQVENDLKDKLKEVCDALDRANSELGEKICEVNEMEFELQIWKSFAERLKVNLEENYELRKELEASLLAQVEVAETFKQEKNELIHMLDEKVRRIDSLQQQVVALDEELKARETEAASSARGGFIDTRKEDNILEDLQKQLGLLEQESLRRELEGAVLAQIAAERAFEHEKQNLIQLVGEKNQRIDDLLHLVTSVEEKFNSSLMSFSSQLSEKQAEINLVSEAWEKITSAEILAMLETEEKKLMIVELEDEIHRIQQKLEEQEKSLYASKQQALEVESELEAKQLEMKRLTCEMENRMRSSDALIDELKNEKQNLVEDIIKLLSERENLCCFIGEMDDKIGKISSEDVHLMGMLGRIVQSFNDNATGVGLKGGVELFGSTKENINTLSSPPTKSFEYTSDGRSPFREVNT